MYGGELKDAEVRDEVRAVNGVYESTLTSHETRMKTEKMMNSEVLYKFINACTSL